MMHRAMARFTPCCENPERSHKYWLKRKRLQTEMSS